MRKLVLALFCFPLSLGAQERPAVQPGDYGRWESPGAAMLSPDGRWLAYAVNRVNEENELRIRDLSGDAERIIAYGSSPAFTGDARWLAYAVGVSAEEREELEDEDRPVHQSVGLVRLDNGDSLVIERIASFRFSPDGRYIALAGYPATDTTRNGAELLVRELETGTLSHFGNVTEFEWSGSGALLAMSVRSASDVGNGIHLFEPAANRLRVLESSTSLYRGLSWREDADDLAVLRAHSAEGFRDTTHAVLAWKGLAGASPLPQVLEAGTAHLPDTMSVSEDYSPVWAGDGSVLFLGLRPRERKEPEDTTTEGEEEDELSDVQVWHARDVRIIPQQRAQEQRDLDATVLAAWQPGADRLVVIGTDLQEEAHVLEGDRHAITTDASGYAFGEMFGRPARDIDLIDIRTGERRRILEDVSFDVEGSATGRYVHFFRDDDWWVYDTTTNRETNVTAGTGGTFVNRDYDYPVDRYPPRGIAGWSTDDRWLLVYDEFDLWRVAPDGSGGERLTDGAREEAIHRIVRLDRDAEGIDLTEPTYLSVTGRTSKKSGYARLDPGGGSERLVLEDARVGRLMRADSADVFAYTSERFDDPPAWFVADPALSDARQVARLNPFFADHAWGRAELVDFTSDSGRALQAALLYPPNHDPARRYPMIVYTYEIVSTQLHGFVVPSERSYYNFAAWTADDYFVLLPDIVYRGREPGVSAVESVVPAVKAVVDRGLVDPARVGLVGHSWGGYQATYIPTQTDIFAASVAGAPITNFLSFAGAIHWRPGIPEFSHWETGQARMGVPYWEDLDAYLRNSPAAHVHRLETPMLMMFGDEDGTVDWHQGVEFYNFARRAGKEDFVLLVYPDEDHGLRQKENQIDYHRRILEWFGHWLKGEPAPEWLKRGVTHLERKAALEGK